MIDLPPTSHFIYIPAIVILGIVLGFIMGSRATREQFRLDRERMEARAKKKAERAAKAADKTAETNNGDDDGGTKDTA